MNAFMKWFKKMFGIYPISGGSTNGFQIGFQEGYQGVTSATTGPTESKVIRRYKRFYHGG